MKTSVWLNIKLANKNQIKTEKKVKNPENSYCG